MKDQSVTKSFLCNDVSGQQEVKGQEGEVSVLPPELWTTDGLCLLGLKKKLGGICEILLAEELVCLDDDHKVGKKQVVLLHDHLLVVTHLPEPGDTQLILNNHEILAALELRLHRLDYGEVQSEKTPQAVLPLLKVKDSFSLSLFFLCLRHPLRPEVALTCYFSSKQTMNRWRVKLSKMLVFNTNFENKYRRTTENNEPIRDGFDEVLVRKKNDMRCTGVFYSWNGIDKGLALASIYNQIEIYRKLYSKAHFPRLKELFLTDRHAVVIHHSLEGQSLSSHLARLKILSKPVTFESVYPILR